MQLPQIIVQQLYFVLPNQKVLFRDLNVNFAQHKIGLVGKNGIGKSSLLKLICGEIALQQGQIINNIKLAHVPQNPLIPESVTISEFLGFADQLHALQRVLAGSTDEKDFTTLNEQWDIEDQLQKILQAFGLGYITQNRLIHSLSGGELTRLLLTKAFHSNADFLLLDEPSNHLDNEMRTQLYAAISKWQRGLIIASHDRALLDLMDEIIELNTLGVAHFGGNYEFYIEQKQLERNASEQALLDAKKQLHKTEYSIQSSKEKHQQKQAYGRKLRKSGSIDKLSANSAKGRSERTQSKLLIKEIRMLNQANQTLETVKQKIDASEEINISLPKTAVPNGKMILDLEDICFSFDNTNLIHNLSWKLMGPEKIALVGKNGSGKTTLVKLILGELRSQSGKIFLGTDRINYLDQHSSLLRPDSSLLNNYLLLNPSATEREAHDNLAKFLFRNVDALKKVNVLSGGEKLRALLACVLLGNHPPQLLILDEPTNHLDLKSIASIESALKNYLGAMIVISHDSQFLKNIGVEKTICAPFKALKN